MNSLRYSSQQGLTLYNSISVGKIKFCSSIIVPHWSNLLDIATKQMDLKLNHVKYIMKHFKETY